jgi:hypothetical protein
MAQTTTDLIVNVNTDQAGKSIGSLKSQLREAQAEVASLADKFGVASKEAIEAAKRAGELKDRIGDAKAMTEAFNPDAKFKAVTASLSGVAGGFAAVQGAMGLLGGESEDVQKMLLKVQSAMAISQGLQSVGEAVDSFKNLGAVIKNTSLFQQAYNFILGQKVVVTEADVIATEAQTVATVEQGVATVTTTTAVTGATTAMKALRIALIASGIGILVVALALAVQAFSNYVGAAAKAEEAQNKLNKKISDGAKVALDAEKNFLEGQEKLDIAQAKAKGASEQQIFEIEQKYRRLRAESHQRHYEEVYGKDAKAAEESSAEINKINIDGQVAAFENEARKRKEYQEKKEREEKEAAEKLQKDLLQSYEDYLKRREFARKNSEGIYIDDIRKFEQEDANERDKKRNDEIDKNVIWQNKSLATIKQTGVQILAIDQANSDAKKKMAEEERNLRVNAAYDIADAAMSLGSIIGEQTKAGKALGIASALINTYTGASEVIRARSTLPEPFGTIQKIASVAAIIATGMRAVKSITAVQVPGGGGGGGASVPSISTQAPILPQLPSAQMTQLNQQSINDLGNQAVRAYVIETDVTGNQQRMAAIRQRARFS